MARERTLSEQAFEQFPQALILVDREATVIALNPVAERLTGWARGDALGRPAADILEVRTETGVNLCAPNGALRRALRLGTRINTHFAYLFRLRTSDDPVRVAYSVAPLHIKGRMPDGAVIVIHDVTPELETIEARDALMLAASHELKTPLTTLKGLSELLLDFDLSEAQRRELLQDLHGQADRMERLIGDILAVSRIDSGRISVDFSRVDVASVVQHVCDEVHPMLKGRSLKCRIPEDLPAVMGEARPGPGGRLRPRHRDGEDCSLSVPAAHVDLAAQHGDQAAYDVQPQPGAGGTPDRRVVGAIKLLE